VSTKIYIVNNGIPSLPVFAIYGRKVGDREREVPTTYPAEETRTFGRTLYSPRHHLDAQGRPIPVRVGMNEKHRIVFVPSKRPATVHALDKPAPVPPAVRKVAKRFKAVAIPTTAQRSR
jgi:hypothetical protein